MVQWGDLHNEGPNGTRNQKDKPGVKSRLDSLVAGRLASCAPACKIQRDYCGCRFTVLVIVTAEVVDFLE